MRGVKGNVAEKGPVLMFLNETKSLSPEEIRGVGAFIFGGELVAAAH